MTIKIQKLLKNYKWAKAGSIGDISCFSFYPTKNLGCFGDGGMVVTDDKMLFERVKLLRMYGEEKRYRSILLGRNSRLDELQAAILIVKLKYLDKWNEERRKIAKRYFRYLNPRVLTLEYPNLMLQVAHAKGGALPSVKPELGIPLSRHPLLKDNGYKSFVEINKKHVYHLFVIRTNKRDELKKYLQEQGIQSAVHYPTPIHLQPSFAYLDYKKGDFPESEKACDEILSLPMYPELKKNEIDFVIKTINKFYETNS